MDDTTPGTWLLVGILILLAVLLAWHVNQIAAGSFQHATTVLTETPKGN